MIIHKRQQHNYTLGDATQFTEIGSIIAASRAVLTKRKFFNQTHNTNLWHDAGKKRVISRRWILYTAHFHDSVPRRIKMWQKWGAQIKKEGPVS
jgi:hypothetical protein